MDAQLVGHAGNCPHAELVLSTDLFKQLHLGSPDQRVSSGSGFAQIRVPVRLDGGQNKLRNWARSDYRNQALGFTANIAASVVRPSSNHFPWEQSVHMINNLELCLLAA